MTLPESIGRIKRFAGFFGNCPYSPFELYTHTSLVSRRKERVSGPEVTGGENGTLAGGFPLGFGHVQPWGFSPPPAPLPFSAFDADCGIAVADNTHPQWWGDTTSRTSKPFFVKGASHGPSYC